MNQKKLGIIVLIKNKYIKSVVTDGDLRRELKNYKNLKIWTNLWIIILLLLMKVCCEKALSIMSEKIKVYLLFLIKI